MRKNIKIYLFAAAVAAASLSACRATVSRTEKIAEKQEEKTETAESENTSKDDLEEEKAESKEGLSEKSDKTGENISSEGAVKEKEEEDITTALFKSAAYVAQNEITTGKTAEYLSYICSFPLKISGLEEQDFYIDSEEELIKFGIERLYTDELQQAIGDFDVDKLVVDGKNARMGAESGKPSIILTEDEKGTVWISEFDY